MIVKEFNPAPTTDRFQHAGNEAEKQMAHYLRRAFGDNPNVHIFNNLRLEHGQEVVQIDHLLFHRAGFIIVESKSVTSSVRINERQEWSRQWNGHWNGMPSPVLQARRQADLLREILQAHKTQLRNKILFGLKQGGFMAFIMDVVVAISDQGVIQHKGELPEVKKADQVPEHLKTLMAAHLRAASLLNSETRKDEMGFNLTPEEFTRISAFLRNRHRDKTAQPVQVIPPAPTLTPSAAPQEYPQIQADVSKPVQASAVPAHQCSKCRSSRLEVKFGHSYYFHCLDCEANTAIKLICPTCNGPARTRKSGKQFYCDCAKCGTSHLFFTNP